MRPRNILYASLFAAGLVLPFGSAAFGTVVISVDKTTQHMRVSVDGAPRYRFPVSTGRPGYGTPSGKFRPSWMAAMHYSKEYENAPMPDSIFFKNGDAIHGFTDTPFGVAAVSHGCVRLPRRDAAALFQLVKQEGMANTTIVVHGHVRQKPVVAQRGGAKQVAENQRLAPTGPSLPEYARPPAYGSWDHGEYGRPDGYYGGWGYGRRPYGGYYARSYSPFWR